MFRIVIGRLWCNNAPLLASPHPPRGRARCWPRGSAHLALPISSIFEYKTHHFKSNFIMFNAKFIMFNDIHHFLMQNSSCLMEINTKLIILNAYSATPPQPLLVRVVVQLVAGRVSARVQPPLRHHAGLRQGGEMPCHLRPSEMHHF